MSTNHILIKFLGIIFLMTGMYRIYLLSTYHQQHPRSPQHEATATFQCDQQIQYVVIGLEVLVGLILLIAGTHHLSYYALALLLIFLCVALVITTYHNWTPLINTFDDTFTFQPTSTSTALHITYAVIIIAILFGK